jgi:hypothetical protein
MFLCSISIRILCKVVSIDCVEVSTTVYYTQRYKFTEATALIPLNESIHRVHAELDVKAPLSLEARLHMHNRLIKDRRITSSVFLPLSFSSPWNCTATAASVVDVARRGAAATKAG